MGGVGRGQKASREEEVTTFLIRRGSARVCPCRDLCQCCILVQVRALHPAMQRLMMWRCMSVDGWPPSGVC
jgi:hypothetical protein